MESVKCRGLFILMIFSVIFLFSIDALYCAQKFSETKLEFREQIKEFSDQLTNVDDYLRPLEPFRKKHSITSLYDSIKKIPVDPHKGFRFVAMGDNKMSTTVYPLLLQQMNTEGAVFAVNSGDLVSKGTVDQWIDYYIPLLERYPDTPVFPVMGNHDHGKDRNQQEFRYLFGNPDYFFDYGGCRFVIIENLTGRDTKIMDSTVVYGISEKQLEWLAQVLEKATGMRKFVFAHVPPATIEKWATKGFTLGAKEFTNLMSKHQVDGVFLGHAHAYSTATRGGVLYTVSGGAGASLKERFGPEGEVYHYVVVTVTPEDVDQEIVKLKWVRSGPGNEYHDWSAEYYKKRWKDQYQKKVKEAIRREATQKIEQIVNELEQ